MCRDGGQLRIFVWQDGQLVEDVVEATPSGLSLEGALAEEAGGWKWVEQARVSYFADMHELVAFYSQFPYDGIHTLLPPDVVSHCRRPLNAHHCSQESTITQSPPQPQLQAQLPLPHHNYNYYHYHIAMIHRTEPFMRLHPRALTHPMLNSCDPCEL